MVINMDMQQIAGEPETSSQTTEPTSRSSPRQSTKPTSRSSPRQSTKPTAKPKERVQFDFSQELLQILDDIIEKTGAATRAEAMRKALRVYDWLADADPDDIIKVIGENNEVIQAVKAKLLL